MNILNKDEVMEEQKHIIGIEPVMDLSNFALLLLADLARKSKIYNLESSNLLLAFLPLNYAEIIEKIMYEKNGWAIKFAELIDIYNYYEYQNIWESEFGEAINKVIDENNLNYYLNFKYAGVEIAFTKKQVEDIRSNFDDETLDIMDHFSNLVNDSNYKRGNILINREIDRYMSRFINNKSKTMVKKPIK